MKLNSKIALIAAAFCGIAHAQVTESGKSITRLGMEVASGRAYFVSTPAPQSVCAAGKIYIDNSQTATGKNSYALLLSAQANATLVTITYALDGNNRCQALDISVGG